ncbi:hypothetical protein C8R44DRAFT_943449 [Mycena epipterygia]|nr:hypothetical protein C8R44DRAFT_943449 [Mycena epipterygia]
MPLRTTNAAPAGKNERKQIEQTDTNALVSVDSGDRGGASEEGVDRKDGRNETRQAKRAPPNERRQTSATKRAPPKAQARPSDARREREDTQIRPRAQRNIHILALMLAAHHLPARLDEPKIPCRGSVDARGEHEREVARALHRGCGEEDWEIRMIRNRRARRRGCPSPRPPVRCA